MLKLGSTGDAVKQWQTVLGINGFVVVVDGAFGPKTEAATKQLQDRLGITADGIVGPATRAALERSERGTWPDDLIAPQVIAHALQLEGLQAGDPTTRAAFEDALPSPPKGTRWPLDVPFRTWRDAEGKLRHQGISTCAMVARRMLERCGLMALGQYPNGDGLDQVIREARKRGAWVEPPRGRMPVGAVFQVLGPMHVGIAIRWEGDVLHSIDGGQAGAKGLQAILACERKLDGNRLGGRVLRGWVDVDRLR
jgi:hypothetical protein